MGDHSQSSAEEIVSIDECAAIGPNDPHGSQSTIPLSKKALHQRDADENLFLRFLELDPPLDPGTASSSALTAAATAATIANSASDQRRKSTYRPTSGRTPFTITKRLVRSSDKGYGFSIVWTHPPRIEKVEKGLSADQAGIIPGDFLIFVDKDNVVTMPEIDILNLIRSQGNTLNIEIFRRSSQSRPSNGTGAASNGGGSFIRRSSITFSNNQMMVEQAASKQAAQQQIQQMHQEPRPSTACSFDVSGSVENTITKRSLKLPQVTFSKESISPHPIEDQSRRYLYQLINREQHFVSALQFGMQRFSLPLQERVDLISAGDHRTLFQNIDEILRLSEDIMEQLVSDDHDPQINFASRVYLSKSTALCAAYKRYCNGLKRADCVLVNKSRNSNSEFVSFITVPPVPRKRPDLTSFIHRPLQHFREVLKFNLMINSHCRTDSEEFRNFSNVIASLQSAYREITSGEGLMEPLGEGRPLLTLQDLEARMVFTKCKPFVLNVPGRQWIFGGDLSRVEGRSVKPYWTLLFSDIIVFAKVSRDRVLFITEEPVLLSHIVDSTFNIRKKTTEFRLTVDPNGRLAESPTAHCAPDLSRTPKKNSRRYVIVLRTPSPELKAVWQNLIQRQIFLCNATLGSSLNSPLESPDIMQTFIPLSEVGAKNSSMASIKLSSADSINIRSGPQKLSKVSKQIEEIIDEKCRFLNKTGTSKGSAIHLAQWMKGQLDAGSQPNISSETVDQNDVDEHETIEEWSPDQLHERTKQLQLNEANGHSMHNGDKSDLAPTETRVCESRMEEVTLSEVEEESKSASKSTTSDSQLNFDVLQSSHPKITVRSSPITNTNSDKISVCRHCHKHCKSKQNLSFSNSLKVQHSQASTPIRCCQSASGSVSSSQKSSSSRTSQQSSQPSTLTGSCHNLNAKLNESELPSSRSDAVALVNGHHDCDSSESTGVSESMGSSSVKVQERRILKESGASSSGSGGTCNCKCDPKDFQRCVRSAQEVRKETCKLMDNVGELYATPYRATVENVPTAISHKNCKCKCDKSNTTTTSVLPLISTPQLQPAASNGDMSDDNDDWSLMLIGLSQLHPAASLVRMDPFDALPSISVVPPTPEGMFAQFCGSPQWDHPKTTIADSQKSRVDPLMEQTNDVTPDDSPQDEEPPYRSLNTTLKRYGTMSSLERFSSEDVEDKTYNSSEEEDDEEDLNDNDNVRIITKEIYGGESTNWTNRAGTFLEQSRAFLDSYLGRWDRGLEDTRGEDDILDECTSGATSGEDVWGTPTSGENDEMQMFNSDQTNSSPTKSSSSLTGDDDTELMMDELLMAPPMTASSIRGLLPRRRLEPLFEEDTESGESDDEKPALDFSSSDQGQVRRIYTPSGRALETGKPIEWPTTLRTPVSAHRAPPYTSAGPPSSAPPPPPPPPRTANSIATRARSYGSAADTCSTPVPTPGEAKKSAENTGRAGATSSASKVQAPAPSVMLPQTPPSPAIVSSFDRQPEVPEPPPPTPMSHTTSPSITIPVALPSTQSLAAPPTPQPPPPPPPFVVGMSPRLEMRLALNNDIMGDEDLICYDPGPDLTSILGHDLSTFHRFTGRDLISRTSSRVQPKEACISFSQQRNSKMDTPTPNRRKPSPNTWSSSAYAVQVNDENLGDLERLARLERKFCESQLRNYPAAAHPFTNPTMNTSPADPASSVSATSKRKKSKFFSFLSSSPSTIADRKEPPPTCEKNGFANPVRRNAPAPVSPNSNSTTHNNNHLDATVISIPLHGPAAPLIPSPRSEVDKSLDRRFWKQLSKRRRSLTVSDDLTTVAS